MPDGQQRKDFRENHKMASDRNRCSVPDSDAHPPAGHSDYRSIAKRMESLRRCGDRRVHHQSTSPHCEGNTFRSDL